MARLRALLAFQLGLLVCLAGCCQPCASEKALTLAALGPLLSAAAPSPEDESTALPAEHFPVTTVVSPEGKHRDITLAECIALALENGRTGEFFDRAGGGRSTSVTGLVRQVLPQAQTDSIRVFTYDPAIVGTTIDQSLARFDVLWNTSFVYDRFDRPLGIDNASSFAPQISGLNNPFFNTGANLFSGLSLANAFTEFDTGGFNTGLVKPLATGGLAGITFRTDYFHVPSTSSPGVSLPVSGSSLNFVNTLPNPAFRPAVELTFEQPLLRGAGVLINQLLDTHPGSARSPLTAGAPAPGILVARISFEQTKLEFERRVHELVLTVEDAYWELYGAYWDLYSREAGMRQALAAWQVAKERYAVGGVGVEEVAQIEGQYQDFRRQRLEALGNGSGGRLGILEAERRLRYVTGLPPEDGTRLIPCNDPVDAPFAPDWDAALAEARARRPELLQIQKEIQAAQLAVRKAKDLLLPDLRFIAKYNVNGLGQTLGSGLEDLTDNQFHEWELGLLMQVPVGFRVGHAEVMRARLQLAQRYVYLRDQESKVILSLQRSHRSIVQLNEEIRIQRSRREAASVQLKAREVKFKAGRETIDFLLQAQRNWADALRDEHLTVCRYNAALADYERQKGTILQYDNVSLVEGQVPTYAQRRASEHIRERNRALVLNNVFNPSNRDRASSDATKVDAVDFHELLNDQPEPDVRASDATPPPRDYHAPIMLPPVPLQ